MPTVAEVAEHMPEIENDPGVLLIAKDLDARYGMVQFSTPDEMLQAALALSAHAELLTLIATDPERFAESVAKGDLVNGTEYEKLHAELLNLLQQEPDDKSSTVLCRYEVRVGARVMLNMAQGMIASFRAAMRGKA